MGGGGPASTSTESSMSTVGGIYVGGESTGTDESIGMLGKSVGRGEVTGGSACALFVPRNYLYVEYNHKCFFYNPRYSIW